jgi:hypothetical protein
MPKAYGGRWETLSSLARGGQAEVYKVRDLQRERSGEGAESELNRLEHTEMHPMA